MRIDLESRLVRASAAIAVGLVAVAGMASTASAQSCNTPWSNCGWTWGERYGAPPSNPYYSYSAPRYPYYGQQPSYYAPQNSHPPAYYGNGYGNGGNPVGQLGGLFVR
jgi:hypothetical protein